jgi:hypothetical protein
MRAAGYNRVRRTATKVRYSTVETRRSGIL